MKNKMQNRYGRNYIFNARYLLNKVNNNSNYGNCNIDKKVRKYIFPIYKLMVLK